MDVKFVLLFIAVIMVCASVNIGIIGVNAEVAEYNLGNHSLSIELNNANEYNVTIENPIPCGRLLIHRLLLVRSANKGIKFWVDEHTKDYPLNLTGIKEVENSYLDSQGIVYSMTDVMIDGHPGYIRHVKSIPSTAYAEETQEYYDAIYGQDTWTSVQVRVVGLGEDVFKQLIGSIHVKDMPK